MYTKHQSPKVQPVFTLIGLISRHLQKLDSSLSITRVSGSFLEMSSAVGVAVISNALFTPSVQAQLQLHTQICPKILGAQRAPF